MLHKFKCQSSKFKISRPEIAPTLPQGRSPDWNVGIDKQNTKSPFRLYFNVFLGF